MKKDKSIVLLKTALIVTLSLLLILISAIVYLTVASRYVPEFDDGTVLKCDDPEIEIVWGEGGYYKYGEKTAEIVLHYRPGLAAFYYIDADGNEVHFANGYIRASLFDSLFNKFTVRDIKCFDKEVDFDTKKIVFSVEN
ncbi:MAG: hypothetical protein IJR90_06170 [Clostridia bacterium]|nr:hypothetical protein [Clostridia bacterium]